MPVRVIGSHGHAARNLCPNHNPMRAEPVTFRGRISIAPKPRTMSNNLSDGPRSAAIEQLEQFGLIRSCASVFS